MTDSPIVIDKLVKHFGTTRAVDGMSFQADAGTVLGLLGPNGSGKTTVVRMLATLMRPDSGTARVAGHDVAREPEAVRSVIGLAGQYAAVDELLTGTENLVMVGRLYGMSRTDARTRALELITRFDLDDARDRTAKTYSGGMRRRLDLAASLVIAPPILFLDEPTTGLDPRSRIAMWEVIERLVDDGTTVLLTTQYLEEADRLASRVVVIDHGKVIANGTPAELKAGIGGSTLEVRVRDANQRVAIADALAEATGAAVDATDGSPVMRVHLAGDTQQLARALDALAVAGVSLDDVEWTRPTMDDVFMKLTGRESSAENAEAEVQ